MGKFYKKNLLMFFRQENLYFVLYLNCLKELANITQILEHLKRWKFFYNKDAFKFYPKKEAATIFVEVYFFSK